MLLFNLLQILLFGCASLTVKCCAFLANWIRCVIFACWGNQNHFVYYIIFSHVTAHIVCELEQNSGEFLLKSTQKEERETHKFRLEANINNTKGKQTCRRRCWRKQTNKFHQEKEMKSYLAQKTSACVHVHCTNWQKVSESNSEKLQFYVQFGFFLEKSQP